MNLKEYQNKVEWTWISNENNALRIICGLGGELGEIFEKLKKYYRDDYNSTEQFLIDLRKEIGDLMYYICKLCNKFGFELENILQENNNKLKNRKKEGKLKGNGDNR